MKNYRVKMLPGCEMAGWDAFVESHPRGTVYHTYAWGSLVEQAYGHKALYFGLYDESGRIVAGVPVFVVRDFLFGKRFSSAPCAQSCTPLTENKQHYEALKRFILGTMHAQGIQNWELRTEESFTHEHPDGFPESTEYVTYRLKLNGDANIVFGGFHKSCIQRAITKAGRSEIQIVRCANLDELAHFYRLYLAMRKKEGLLPQPYRFFRALWQCMSPRNRIDVLYAVQNRRVISTILALRYQHTVTYEYGATAEGMQKTGVSPYLIWEAIQQACLEGYRTFDFGRTGACDEGLNTFKKRWGAFKVPLRYYSISSRHISPGLQRSKRATGVMAALVHAIPATLCELIGRLIYRYLV